MRRGQPLVAIGMPVFNGGLHLEAALDSILSQTFGDFELVISDNASTDHTEAICRRYAQADARVRYVRNPINIGAGRNYCQVFALSSAPYFKWANADDLIGRECLERCLEALRAQPDVVLAYSRTELIDGAGRRISVLDDNLRVDGPDPGRRFMHVIEHLAQCNLLCGLVRREVLERTGLMGSYIGCDCVLVAELALHGRFHQIPDVLFSRRVHAGAYSSQTDPVARLKFYNPTSTRGFASIRWRRLWEYARAVRRAPLSAAPRMRLWRGLLRIAVWQRRALLNEIRLLAGGLSVPRLR